MSCISKAKGGALPSEFDGMLTWFCLLQETAPYSNKYLSDRYLCWATAQSRYILGDHKLSYVVGFGSDSPAHAQDRGAACPSAPQNCTSVNSLYNPSANPHVINGALVFVSYPLSAVCKIFASLHL